MRRNAFSLRASGTVELSETRLSRLGWPSMSCWKGGHLSPGGGGGGARLGPTADGRRGGGVGRCAPIWVLINPFTVVRDEQSLQRPFTPIITRSRWKITLTLTITLTITTNANGVDCSSLTTGNGFMRTQIVSHRRGRVPFTSVSDVQGRDKSSVYYELGWERVVVTHHGPMTGGVVSKSMASQPGQKAPSFSHV